MRSVQVAYQSIQPLPAATGQGFVSAAKPSVFRLEVINVPQYLHGDEFRAQFLKLDGCVDAVVENDDARSCAAYFIDFNTQDLAEKCIVSFTQWKGWGPKGLAFRRVGFVFPNLSSLPTADGGAQTPAKQPQITSSAHVKQGGVNSVYVSAPPMAPTGSVIPSMDHSAGFQQPGPSSMQQQAIGLTPQPGTIMYQRPDGSLYIPNHGESMAHGPPPPSASGAYAMQPAVNNQPGGEMNTMQQASYGQKDSSAPGAKPGIDSHQRANTNTVQAQAGMNGMAANAPSIQYVRLADGSLKAMMAVTNSEPQRVNILDQHSRPAPATQAVANVPPSVMMSHGVSHGQPQQIQLSEPPVLVSGPPGVPSSMPVGQQPPLNAADDRQFGNSQIQYISQPSYTMNAPAPAHVRVAGMPVQQLDSAPSMDGSSELPANASQTLYVDDVPLDMQKRELCHIFRPFGGFKEVRIVTKTTKDGRPYSFAFAQFENAECAAAALGCLNGYQYDPDNPELGAMQLKYARQERNKGAPRGYDDIRAPHRSRQMRGDVHDSNENSNSGRFRRPVPDQKRPRQQY